MTVSDLWERSSLSVDWLMRRLIPTRDIDIKDIKRERQRCLYQHNQKSDLKVTHFNFWIFLNE